MINAPFEVRFFISLIFICLGKPKRYLIFFGISAIIKTERGELGHEQSTCRRTS